MRDMLINLGYEVIISNEFNVVRDVRDLNCNVVIANFIMKEKTGDKTLEDIKGMYPKTKCILSSSNDIKLKDLNNKVIDAFIQTPVTIEKLQEAFKDNNYLIKESLLNEYNIKSRPSFCRYCGEKLDVNDEQIKFCEYCGKMT
jgi:response regulator RpfG family c-di-GMP phosphodiesterase